MKNYFQRLQELPITHLSKFIARQKLEIELAERDLERMKKALAEKAN